MFILYIPSMKLLPFFKDMVYSWYYTLTYYNLQAVIRTHPLNLDEIEYLTNQKESKESKESEDSKVFWLLFGAHEHSYPFPFLQFVNNNNNNNNSNINYAIINYEQAASSFLADPIYLLRLSRACFICDYSHLNREKLIKLFPQMKIWVIPIGYAPNLTYGSLLQEQKKEQKKEKEKEKEKEEEEEEEEEEVDVLFYGCLSERRRVILSELQKKGCKVEFCENKWEFELVNKIKKAKIILNLHFYITPSVLEQARLSVIIANGGYVISEPSDDLIADQQWEPYVTFVRYEDMVSSVSNILNTSSSSQLRTIALHRTHHFRQHFTATAALRHSGALFSFISQSS